MTNHYVKTLGVEKCREILKGANELDFAFDTIDEEYFRGSDIQDGYSVNDYEDCVVLADLRHELTAHDTDHCSDIRNHISPTTVVIER